MALRGDERYVTVQGTLKAKTANAVLIETEAGEGWVARSCIAWVTDQAVTAAAKGDEIEFQVMEWAAEQKGLI